MRFDPAEWGPPVAVLIGGLALGALFLRSRSSDAGVVADGQRRDLAANREAAVEALRQLELDREKLDPEVWRTEREALLARGAAALRQLETGPATADAPRAPEPAPERPLISPEWRGAGWASLVWALVGLLVWFATSNSVERREGASMTGNQDLGPATGAPPEWTAAKQKAEAAVAANPNDVAAHNELTWLYLQSNEPPKAMEHNRKVLELDPKNNDGRAYRGLLAASVQMYDRALADLDAVLADDPKHEKALVYRGLLLIETGKNDQAIPALEAALAVQPGNPTLTRALGIARQRAGAPTPPVEVEVVAQGTVTLAQGAQAAISAGDTLYISVRDPAGGPPLAALKLPAGPFPAKFEVTTANLIAMGGSPRPVPPTVDLRVFIDKDGNPMTKDEGLPSASLPGVAKGATGLAVELAPAP